MTKTLISLAELIIAFFGVVASFVSLKRNKKQDREKQKDQELQRQQEKRLVAPLLSLSGGFYHKHKLKSTGSGPALDLEVEDIGPEGPRLTYQKSVDCLQPGETVEVTARGDRHTLCFDTHLCYKDSIGTQYRQRYTFNPGRDCPILGDREEV